jgi:hypothetical protein
MALFESGRHIARRDYEAKPLSLKMPLQTTFFKHKALGCSYHNLWLCGEVAEQKM